jgi:hypothetical protein
VPAARQAEMIGGVREEMASRRVAEREVGEAVGTGRPGGGARSRAARILTGRG